jgi:hypothetical protein
MIAWLYQMTFGQLDLWFWRRKIRGGMTASMPRVGIKATGSVINPGDPDWIPSPKFVPPPGWQLPAGWQFDPHLGWSRVVEYRNSQTADERLH